MNGGKILFMKFLGDLNILQIEKVDSFDFFRFKIFDLVFIDGNQCLSRNSESNSHLFEEKP